MLLQLYLHASRLCRQQTYWPHSLLGTSIFVSELAPSQRDSLLQPYEEPAAIKADSKPERTWAQRLSFRGGQKSSFQPKAGEPQTISDVADIVAANVPVFCFHDQERYFPCTVEWFLERSRLVKVAKGWRRTVLETLVDFGLLNGEELARQQAEFNSLDAKKKRRQFLQLQLKPSARGGQPGNLNEIPIYAHVKQTLDPILGKRDGIEINYMKFLAFNGPYKLFHSLWVGPLGAHDADWEHVTVRLTPDGKSVTGVYYSAHRHRDGMWRSADSVPLSSDGRPMAYIAENGHGSYPTAGTILRLFFVINDYTSANGHKWDPDKVVLVTHSADDKLPAVVSRGNSLNGTTYPAAMADSRRSNHQRKQVERQNAPWLKYEGKWGSTVEAPQRQEWYARAENPVSRTWLQQIFLPLLPGVESIWEPALEELEEAVDNLTQGVDDGLEIFKDAADDVQREFERSREAAYKRWRDMMKALKRRDSK